MYFLFFVDLLFQPHIFLWSLIISKSAKYDALLHIIMTYIKENKITKWWKLYSRPRNLMVSNKLLVLFLKKPFCTGNLSPACKIYSLKGLLKFLSNKTDIFGELLTNTTYFFQENFTRQYFFLAQMWIYILHIYWLG